MTEPYELVMAKVAEAWNTAEPGLLAKRDQQAAELRMMLREFGVDLTDREVLRGLAGLIWAMNHYGELHAAKGCCGEKLAMAGECLRVAGVASLVTLHASREG